MKDKTQEELLQEIADGLYTLSQDSIMDHVIMFPLQIRFRGDDVVGVIAPSVSEVNLFFATQEIDVKLHANHSHYFDDLKAQRAKMAALEQEVKELKQALK